jgi:hypothetical protein
MGYDQQRIEVVVSVSRHNDERDERDDKLLEELRAAIRALAEQPRFEPLRAMVD